jgi:hypothetical protein
MQVDPAQGPFLLVCYEHDDGREDLEAVMPDEMPSRLRFASE